MSLAHYRAGLEAIGRSLAWTPAELATFAQDWVRRPWPECGWQECDVIIAGFGELLDRYEALIAQRRLPSGRGASGVGPLPTAGDRPATNPEVGGASGAATSSSTR